MKGRILARTGAAIAMVALALSMMLGAAPRAEAAVGISVSQACFNEYTTYDTTHGSTAVSWRCVLHADPVTTVYEGVDLTKFYCNWYYPGTHAGYSDFNNPYSWYCA